MNSIVGRLTTVADKKRMAGEAYPLEAEAVTYIEQQAARIAELEAEVEANLQERVRMQHTINQYESGDKVSRHYACPDCAALRQRIDDAPVTWHYITNETWYHYSTVKPPEDAYDEGSLNALISKEDLQK